MSTAIALLLSLISTTSAAQADSMIYAMQLKLKETGDYTARADGHRGPSTARAIRSYASRHSIQATESDVAKKMAIDAVMRSHKMNNLTKKMAEETLKGELKDPYSAVISFDHYFYGPAFTVNVCGEVNAKNNYGAFTGTQPVAIWLLLSPGLPPGLRSGGVFFQDDGAYEMCVVGASIGAAILK